MLSPLQDALLGVLVSHGRRGLRRGQLLSFLWRDGTDALLRPRLNQLIYSLHQRLGGERRIQMVGDHYVMDTCDLSSDLEQFLVSLRNREPALAVDIAARGFLSGLRTIPTCELERWVEEKDLRFRSDVRELAAELSAEGEQTANWTLTENAAHTLLELDASDETALKTLLRARALLGKVGGAQAAFAAYRDRARLENPSWEPAEGTRRVLARLEELAEQGSGQARRSTHAPPGDPLLVGRTEELHTLAHLVRTPPDGELSTIWVTGEGGIGKTRLVTEALAAVQLDGIRVLSGRCSEFEQNIPLSPILRSLSLDWVVRGIRQLPERWRSVLLSLLPETLNPEERIAAPVGESLEQLPRATCEAFLRLFASLSESDPVVLFLDDFQWIDATSLAVLSYLRERWTGPGLVLVLTLRPGAIERESRIARWSEGTVGSPPHRMQLGPLTRPETLALMKRVWPEGADEGAPEMDRAQRLQAAADLVSGHPLLALEWARAQGHPLTRREPRPSMMPIPEAVRAIVSSRTKQLSRGAQLLLGSLSASEKPLPYSVLETAAAFPSSALSGALDEALRENLLSVSPRGIEFRHGLFREAVYQGLSQGQRIAVHRRIADALTSIEDERLATDIALHLFAAAEPQMAMPYVLDAAQRATDSGGWTEARTLLELALDADPEPRERAPIASLLGRLLSLCGEFDEAERVWSLAEEAYRRVGDEEMAMSCHLHRLGASRYQPRSSREGLLRDVRQLQEAASDRCFPRVVAASMTLEARVLDELRRVEDVKGLTSAARTRANVGSRGIDLDFLLVSMIEIIYGDPAHASALADEAIELARDRSEPHLLLEALNWKLIALSHQGELNMPEGKALVRTALDAAQHSTDIDQRFRLDANLGVWYMDTGDYDKAARAFERAGRALDELPAPHLRRNLLVNRGQLAFELGNLDVATTCFQASMESERIADYEPLRCVALSGLGLCHLAVGEISRARRILDLLPAKPGHWTFDPFLWLMFETRTSMYLGRSREALERLQSDEQAVRHRLTTTWIRLKLLRFEMRTRQGLSLAADEVESFRSFLVARGIDGRLRELTALLTS